MLLAPWNPIIKYNIQSLYHNDHHPTNSCFIDSSIHIMHQFLRFLICIRSIIYHISSFTRDLRDGFEENKNCGGENPVWSLLVSSCMGRASKLSFWSFNERFKPRLIKLCCFYPIIKFIKLRHWWSPNYASMGMWCDSLRRIPPIACFLVEIRGGVHTLHSCVRWSPIWTIRAWRALTTFRPQSIQL